MGRDKKLEKLQLEEIQVQLTHRDEMILNWRKLVALGQQIEEHWDYLDEPPEEQND